MVPTTSFGLHTKFEIISGYVDPNLYFYCKGHVWSWHAESQHQRTDALVVTAGLIFRLCSGAGWIGLYRLAGMGTNEISDNRRSRIGTCPSCGELKHAPGWDGGCV